MADDTSYTQQLFLRLDASGFIGLDRDYMWDGCDTPEIDPEIDLTPVPLQKLARLLAALYIETAEKDDAAKLKITLSEIRASGVIIEKAIKDIEAKFS